MRYCPAREFDGNHGRHALRKCHQTRLAAPDNTPPRHRSFSPGSPPAGPPRRTKAESRGMCRPARRRLFPICSGGPPSAPIVITMPSTAATIPSPGRASATVSAIAPAPNSRDDGYRYPPPPGIQIVRSNHSRYGSAQCIADEIQNVMVLQQFGVLENSALFSGFSMSSSSFAMPLFRAN